MKDNGFREINEDLESSDSNSSNNSEAQRRKKKKRGNIEDNLAQARNNLKFKSMAKYKALADGEIQMYTDIENQLVDLAICKGIACDDSDIEY